MPDIFDNEILCKNCHKTMKPLLVTKNGFNLRVLKCAKCGALIVHPADKAEYENFMKLKNKEFEVKMRMVGNSYSVSIPREIVDFMHDQENMMDNMVKMCFHDANKLSLMFNTPSQNMAEDSEGNKIDSRVVKAREIRVVRNNKPVLHVRQVSDSKHPERNQTRIFKANNKLNEAEEEEEL